MWTATVEFEVFADHVVIYRFSDLLTDIEHHAHNPGESFSPEVIAALPSQAGQNGLVEGERGENKRLIGVGGRRHTAEKPT